MEVDVLKTFPSDSGDWLVICEDSVHFASQNAWKTVRFGCRVKTTKYTRMIPSDTQHTHGRPSLKQYLMCCIGFLADLVWRVLGVRVRFALHTTMTEARSLWLEPPVFVLLDVWPWAESESSVREARWSDLVCRHAASLRSVDEHASRARQQSGSTPRGRS